MKEKNVSNIPVVMVTGNNVTKYYTNVYATIRDGFDPYRVLKVCAHAQKTHRGKIFRYASEADTLAYEILTGLKRGGGEKENDN